MQAADIFSICNQVILLGWVLLIFLPNWKYTQAIILNGLIVLFACIYAFLILKDIGNFNPESFSSLANVKALFQNDDAVAAGWIHYLAFDLFVGTYIVKNQGSLGFREFYIRLHCLSLLCLAQWVICCFLFLRPSKQNR